MNFFLKIFKLLPPELAHSFSLNSLKILYKFKILGLFFNKIEHHEKVTFLGMEFNNRLGTAAGLDKNGDYIDSLGALGFGFLEVGTVTPLPQPGNPKPRIFRNYSENSIVNRLGFNNKGVDYLVSNLKKRKYKGILGINIGANKNSDGDERINDYIVCLQKVIQYADYITINISSPNTPNLRDLQEKKPLTALVKKLCKERLKKSKEKPLLLKISPDLSEKQLLDIISVIETENLDGLIATNTTIQRENLESNPKITSESGGLSGKKLTSKSNEVIRFIHENSNGTFPIIGVGGIFDAEDVIEKFECGASLVQIYTGFIYEGPSIVKTINKKLIRSKFNF